MEELRQLLYSSPSSIRRDLTNLEKKGLEKIDYLVCEKTVPDRLTKNFLNLSVL